MKKLALALVCLMGVAFFTSCDPETVVDNPEPIIKVMTNENYLADSTVINLDQDYEFGFTMTSNPETGVELSLFELFVDGVLQDSDTIDAAEYDYEGIFTYSLNEREIIGDCIITGRVTDANNKSATASIYLKVNKEENLVTIDYTWQRKGSYLQGDTQEDMEKYGLQWLSRDAFHANIQPLPGCTLYVVEDNAAEFEGVNTVSEKAAYISKLNESIHSVDEYRRISVASNGDKVYNDILAVIDAEGNYHMVLIEKANVLIQSGVGVTTTVTAHAK